MERRATIPILLVLGWMALAPATANGNRGGSTLWNHDEPAAVTGRVAVSGDGSTLAVAQNLNDERLVCYELAAGTQLWEFPGDADFDVSICRDGSLMAVTNGQYLHLFGRGSNIPIWSYDFGDGLSASSPTISRDGSTVIAGARRYGPDILAVALFDASSATPLWTHSPDPAVSGGGPYGSTLTTTGSRAAMTFYNHSLIFNRTSGDPIQVMERASQTPVHFSGDGAYLAEGGLNKRIKLFQWTEPPGEYQELWNHRSDDTWIISVALSEDGGTLAAGTLGIGSSSYWGTLLVFDVSSQDPLFIVPYGDEIFSLSLTPDGSRIMAGSYGQYGGTYGDVATVLSRDAEVLFRIRDDLDEPGSCFSVGLADDGSLAAASGKAVHARTLGSGGFLYALSITGEPLTPTPAPTETPVPPTGTPVPTDTPAPTETPIPSVTPEPSPTPPMPTWTPVLELGVRIDMPTWVSPGQEFGVTGYLENPGPPRSEVPVLFVLSMGDSFWFWPSWALYHPPDSMELDYELREVPVGSTPVSVIPSLIWPDTGDQSAGGLHLLGAMLDPDMTRIEGRLADVEWGFGP